MRQTLKIVMTTERYVEHYRETWQFYFFYIINVYRMFIEKTLLLTTIIYVTYRINDNRTVHILPSYLCVFVYILSNISIMDAF